MTKRMKILALLLSALLLTLAPAASAQTPPPPYGPPITLAQARKVAEAAEAEAKKNKWNVVIAVVDSGGNLVLLHRLDDTQIASVQIAQKKAWTANGMRRATKVFEDGVAAGGAGLRVLGIEQIITAEGGVPLVADGKIVGAIGISGVTSQQDGQIARAGAEALK
jgi:glc operon protein GlcG